MRVRIVGGQQPMVLAMIWNQEDFEALVVLVTLVTVLLDLLILLVGTCRHGHELLVEAI